MENSPQIGKRQFGQKEKKDIILLKHFTWGRSKHPARRRGRRKREGKSCRTNESGCGAVEARADEVVDGVGVASQGCVRLACLVEIE
jgi:hypothetical protein